ncbi:MAG: putative quinol monooxygenase [Parasphingopyxis sp.]|uniref:putative quinol monooxygenase n=1 Tax=Parasphingopyxis sp. TaxID=1920299 RepID=UPI0026205C64|nr:putative quinol monooxygenase [uncultured Parasphingopyxis sp.]
MIAIIATLTVKDGAADEVAAALNKAAPACRSDAEPGCHYYQPTQLADDPNVFKVFEVYEDQAALAAHRETAHFQPLAELFGKHLAKAPEIDLLKPLD